MGVEKGDRIIVSLPNTPHYFIIANAVFKMGATLVQSNPIYTERELRHIAKNSEAKMMFAMDLSYNNYRALIEEGIFERVVIAKFKVLYIFASHYHF
jgi:long-chain acyl-CoA synthetase